MQVRPRGQKKPGQHGLQPSALDGTVSSNEVTLVSFVEQAQPDWQPSAHELWLQFLLILPTRLLPKLLRYNFISALLHSIVTICPLLCSMQSEMKLVSVKLNVWLKSLSTLEMQKPYLLSTSPVSSLVTVAILERSASSEKGDGGSGGSDGGDGGSGGSNGGDGGGAPMPPGWHRPPAGSSARTRRRNSTPGSGLGGMELVSVR